MNEEWRDVVGFEGLYEVSDFGRVRRNGRILKPEHPNGYLLVNLYKNGTRKSARIHRLVALAFLPNPQNLPCVNHKDEDKTNNALDNLEWCDSKYNINYGTRTQRFIEKKSKPVLQYDLNGNLIREWPSATKVEEELGINQGNISMCCNGRYKSAGNFVWRFK